MIEIRSLYCSYNKKTVLKNIDIKIENHLNILGVNGSGKSTLAKAICRVIKYSGNILLEGKEITNLTLPQRAKEISYIPPKLEVYDKYISVDEFVLLGRFTHKQNFSGYSKEDIAIKERMIKLLKIEHLKKHSLFSLSSGEQQLVQIATAMTQQSKTIIFDEPTANLDPKNSKTIAQHIKELKKHHNIILITHDLHLAKYLQNKVVFIKNKKLLHFRDNDSFFSEKNLSKLYNVEFDFMDVKYD